ncbi:MAG: ATP-dependent exonuclase V beta subunit, helicase and exonuclease domain-containing [bacterium P3]|nr:MAG: ATP-dependent exonuclase V beta subunit, helicase and exonuclease domain-containing [bacterium P3]KWW42450.1 MAG: ATP-dependent exonuclase V beta subunit, helicase and exonuclease domain-containing [bacterium F083]
MQDKAQFVICKASAGSGKTYTLVREYLRLAFDVPEAEWPHQFRRILAITFTNKAANEMKERVLTCLDGMSQHGTETAMGADLARMLGWTDSRIRMAAATVHAAILHGYSDFAVSTIDRFMSRIVHTFARDLHLPVGFEVVTDGSQLLDVSVDTLLDLAGQPGEQDLSDILCDFIANKMEDGKSNLFEKKGLGGKHSIDGSIRELAKALFQEDVPGYLNRLSHLGMHDFRELNRTYRAENARLEQRVAGEAREVLRLCAERGLTGEMFYYGNSGVYSYFARCAAGQLVWPAPGRVVDFFSGGKRAGSKCPVDAAAAIDDIYPRMESAYRHIDAWLEVELPRYNTRKELLRHLFPLALLGRIAQLVEQQYGEQEVIHISEFNKQIFNVVQNEPMPFVYERIGSRYRYYLIDEFQDTSRMQWQNLLPLVSNSVSAGGFALVVGDAKQAIYRFRQGDVEQFVALPHVDNAVHGALLEHPGVAETRRLERNYRSAATVVRFNNDFYRWLAAEHLCGNEMLHSIFIGGDAGHPDLWQEPVRDGGFVSMDFWKSAGRDGGEVDKMWRRVYDIIRRQVDEMGYRLSEITVLARDKKTLNAVAAYLSSSADGRTPVPMVSEESFLLRNSTAVMLLRAALLWVADEHDRVAALQVLEYMHRLGLLEGDYAAAVIERGLVHLSDILSAAGYDIPRDMLCDLPLYECCEALVRALRLHEIETGYIISMLGRVQEYGRRHRNHIGEFVEWFDRQNFSLSTPDVLDSVHLSTIHKAKGLESPVIIYVIPPHRAPQQSLWVELGEHLDELSLPVSPVTVVKESTPLLYGAQLQQESSRRQIDDVDLLYVATTRPCDKLYVLSVMRERNAGEGYAEWLYAYVRREPPAEPSLVWHHVDDGDGECFSCGADTAVERRDTAAGALQRRTVRPTLHFVPWEEKVVVAMPPSDETGLRDDPRHYGLAMHEILSQLMDDSDVEQAVGLYCMRRQAPEGWRDRLCRQIRMLFERPESVCFFDHRHTVRNECELMCDGQVLRPDRVLFLPQEVWIVDFKTGEPEHGHYVQVEAYKQALAAMGYDSVRGFLLYTQTADVTEV